MAKLKGITITLINKVETGEDPFGAPLTNKVETEVENVLISPLSTDDLVNELKLSGKTIAYQLAVPKGDTNDWVNAEVRFWGQRFRTVGVPEQGIEALIPLDWNKKVKVERFE